MLIWLIHTSQKMPKIYVTYVRVCNREALPDNVLIGELLVNRKYVQCIPYMYVYYLQMSNVQFVKLMGMRR